MSLGSILANGLSGLQANQTALKTISQNVANANTPGYVRVSAVLSSATIGGAGAGVEVTELRRAADRFLAAAHARSASSLGAAEARASLLDRAQAALGDPNGESSLFNTLDAVFTSFQKAVSDVSSPIARSDVIASVDALFSQISSVATEIESLTREADQRVASGVATLEGLLQRIAGLNAEVTLARRGGADSTGAENVRDQLIDEVATLIDIRVTAKDAGAVQLRTPSGALLVGERAARLTHTPQGIFFAAADQIEIDASLASGSTLDRYISGGALHGLIQARDFDLPAYGDALAELAGAVADELNAVHNENSGFPPATTLTGRQTGLLSTDGLNFSGEAVVALVDASGALSRRLTIDFTAGTIVSENPASTTSFTATVGGFAATLDAVLRAAPAAGSASFANGVFAINSNNGVFVQQGTPESSRQDRGFAHFFGLNDLVRRPNPAFFEIGVSSGEAHGLAPGGAITFRITDANGARVGDRTVTPTGTTWASLISDLESVSSGVGQFVDFSLDADGKLSFQNNPGYRAEIIADTTERAGTGVSVSAIFGLDRSARAGRALELAVDPRIAADATRLGLGRPDAAAAIGATVVNAFDSRGASSLAQARETTRSFAGAGGLSAQSSTLTAYVNRIASEAGRAANAAEQKRLGAQEILDAAKQRRTQTEGVSLDDELVAMSNYQQAYAAASRVLQAANEMFDILLQIS